MVEERNPDPMSADDTFEKVRQQIEDYSNQLARLALAIHQRGEKNHGDE